jgi:DNA-binding NarL/FixJ family response regulator
VSARIVIVDDHPVVRQGLQIFLDRQDDVEVVGQAGSIGEALSLVSRVAPDLVLLDLQLPDRHGLQAIPDLLAIDPAPIIVVLTSFVDDDSVRRAIRLGASGYLAKHADPGSLVDGIRAALRGELPLDPSATRALAVQRRDPIDQLTPREREVLEHLAQGRSNRTIAETLFITEKTVKTHVSAVLAKLGVVDRTQAALYARDHGL